MFELIGLHLDVPDHTTLSRRSKTLTVKLRAPRNVGPIDLIIDSTGLSIVGHNGWSRIEQASRYSSTLGSSQRAYQLPKGRHRRHAKHGERGRQGWMTKGRATSRRRASLVDMIGTDDPTTKDSPASQVKPRRTVSISLTDSNVDDAKTGMKMIISKPRATRRHGAPFQDVHTCRHAPATLRSHHLQPSKENAWLLVTCAAYDSRCPFGKRA